MVSIFELFERVSKLSNIKIYIKNMNFIIFLR